MIAITQRDPTQFYDHIAADKESIFQDIKSFFEEFIQNKFQSKSYVFDILRMKKDKVKLIDFNPFGPTTDPQLFSWSELEESEFPKPEFRYIRSEMGIQPDGLGRYGIPQDFNDLASGTDPNKLIDLLQLRRRQQEEESSEGED